MTQRLFNVQKSVKSEQHENISTTIIFSYKLHHIHIEQMQIVTSSSPRLIASSVPSRSFGGKI